MANTWYPLCVDAWEKNTTPVDLDGDTIKAILVDLADYTYNAAHEFLSDVPAAARVATSAALANKTVSARVFDADNAAFTAVAGDQVEAIILYKDTGVEATSRLVLFLDTGITGMPYTPSGADVTVAWDNGANKIARL